MAVFFQIAGTQLVLPDYARADLAFQQTTFAGTIAAGQDFNYTAGGTYIELALNVFAQFTTSAHVANRAVFVQALATIVAPSVTVSAAVASSVQAANDVENYVFNVGLPAAYGPVSNVNIIGMPVVVLLPGYTLQLGAQLMDAGDQFTQVTVTTIRVPTGPELAVAPPPLAPALLA